MFLKQFDGPSPNNIYLVGTRGSIFKYDGKKVSKFYKTRNGEYIRCIYVKNPDDILVAGQNGTIIKYNGKNWETLQENTPQIFSDIALKDNIYYISDTCGKSVFIEKNNIIKPFNVPSTSCVNSFISLKDGNIMAAGENGVIATFNGKKMGKSKKLETP